MFNFLTKQGSRRGIQTIEFSILVFGWLAAFCAAMSDSVNAGDALSTGTVLTAAFIASRGLSKLGAGMQEYKDPPLPPAPTNTRRDS